jgi:FkbM family methyltransferase
MRHAFEEARPEFEAGRPVPLGELGPIVFPYERRGAIDTIDEFGLDELLIFAFYWRNRGTYRAAVDIGANLGLHSIVLGKCGFKSIRAFEPDPKHLAKLRRNLALNRIDGCEVREAAVSDKDGRMEFVRVLGNTTGSHLAGAKSAPYGELERFEVPVVDCRKAVADVDLAKIDAEGHEAVLLKCLPDERWRSLDAIVEIGTEANARLVHERFATSGINLFSQKSGWERVTRLAQMPASYKEGSLFISAKNEMPW